MPPLDRRTFFSHSLAAASGLVAAPTWLVRAFRLEEGVTQDPQPGAVDDPVAKWRKEQLAAALATAKAHGKPLLVLVVPDELSKVYEAGTWFGSWLTHGDAQSRLALGLCTLACARVGEVAEVVGVRGEVVAPTTKLVTMLWIDVAPAKDAAEPPRATRMEQNLPQVPNPNEIVLFNQKRKDPEPVRRKGLQLMTESLMAGFARHGATIEDLAASSLATLDEVQRKALADWFARGGSVQPELLVRGLALLRQHLGSIPEAERVGRLDQLTKAVDAVVTRRPLAGALWMRMSTCGAWFETGTGDEEETALLVHPCGGGIVPPLCERFLSFFALPETAKLK